MWTLSTEEMGFEWLKCEQMMTEDSFFAQALFMSGTDVFWNETDSDSKSISRM